MKTRRRSGAPSAHPRRARPGPATAQRAPGSRTPGSRGMGDALATVALGWTVACASASTAPVMPAPSPVVARPSPEALVPAPEEVIRGELPWWFDLAPGAYRVDGELWVVAVGDSRDHHHIAEGFLQAKVLARLGVRRASESIQFTDGPPEPALEDLFITRERRVLALYVLRVPKEAAMLGAPSPLSTPTALKADGRHRVGRHVFENERHLFLECDVEGPVANPDWGRTQAAARN